MQLFLYYNKAMSPKLAYSCVVGMAEHERLPLWWGELDLNQRPIGYEPTALTTELSPHVNRDEYTRFTATVI